MARTVLPPSAYPPDDSQSEPDETESDQMERTASQSQVRLDSGSDADSGSSFPSPTASAFVLKQNPNSKKEKKRAAAAAAAVDTHESEVKKKPKKNGIGAVAAEEDKAKKNTGRLWCPEDELLILEGMLDYKQEAGVDPSSSSEAFHSYIKDSLNAIADKSQVSSKIRKLREKYKANALKEANGEPLPSLKGHEALVYEHSKKIWGHKVIARGSQATKTKPKNVDVVPCASVAETDSILALPVPERQVSSKVVNSGGNAKVSSRAPKVARKMDLDDADHEKKDSIIKMPVLFDSFLIEKGLEFVERSKLDALNEKWTKYQLDAAELYVRRLELVGEQTRLILNAQKSNS